MPFQNKKLESPQISGEELLDSMANTNVYSHLRIILSHKSDKGTLPQCYLMVSPNSFGVVELFDINYEDEKVILHLQDVSTGIDFKVFLDIHEKRYKFLLIKWQDVLDMVLLESNRTRNDKNLMELMKVMTI
jgi:hypothetical protein